MIALPAKTISLRLRGGGICNMRVKQLNPFAQNYCIDPVQILWVVQEAGLAIGNNSQFHEHEFTGRDISEIAKATERVFMDLRLWSYKTTQQQTHRPNFEPFDFVKRIFTFSDPTTQESFQLFSRHFLNARSAI